MKYKLLRHAILRPIRNIATHAEAWPATVRVLSLLVF
jgi:hypothetical protein